MRGEKLDIAFAALLLDACAMSIGLSVRGSGPRLSVMKVRRQHHLSSSKVDRVSSSNDVDRMMRVLILLL